MTVQIVLTVNQALAEHLTIKYASKPVKPINSLWNMKAGSEGNSDLKPYCKGFQSVNSLVWSYEHVPFALIP